ncbi:hypothetical protein [Rheinheimera soli]|uniref:hypothetical protein n=1 Tax=Rheinheimera soli TaxID=443616 RepID=UPI001E551B8D|nr:hypothetical protein [Rheinheimera soli]
MRLVVLAFYLLCLTGCSEQRQAEAAAILQLHQDDQVSVSLSPAEAPVEQLLNWSVQLSEGWHIKHAEVVGVSMSMGTIPLLFKAVTGQQQQYVAEMVLGACSQPKMKWQLQLTLLHVTQGEKVLLLPFYSSWPV